MNPLETDKRKKKNRHYVFVLQWNRAVTRIVRRKLRGKKAYDLTAVTTTFLKLKTC